MSYHEIFSTFIQLLWLPTIICFALLMSGDLNYEHCIYEDENIFNLNNFGETVVPYSVYTSSNFSLKIANYYQNVLQNSSMYKLDLRTRNLNLFLVQKAQDERLYYNRKYIIGASFELHNNMLIMTGFYNSAAYHSAGMSLLYLYNSLMKTLNEDEGNYFSLKNKPLPYKDVTHEKASTLTNVYKSLFWAHEILFGAGFLMRVLPTDVIVESITKFKEVQYSLGYNGFVFYTTSFIYDMFKYMVSSLLALLQFQIFVTPCFSQDRNMEALTALMMIHGVAAILMSYCAVFISKKSSRIKNGIFFYYLTGIALLTVIFELQMHNFTSISQSLDRVFSVLFTPYTFGRGIFNIHRECMVSSCRNLRNEGICNTNGTFVPSSCCTEYIENIMQFGSDTHSHLSAVSFQLMSLFFQVLVYVVLIISLEIKIIEPANWSIRSCYNALKRNCIKKTNIPKLPNLEIGHEVRKSFLCVVSEKNGIGFGVEKNDCLAIVGSPDSGKEKLLNIVSGYGSSSSGLCFLDGIDVKKNLLQAMDKISSSFNLSCLPYYLTVDQLLVWVARIKGIQEEEIPCSLEEIKSILSLPYDRKIKSCSAIEKSKLCIAVAVMGYTPVIVLHQPAENTDPEATAEILQLIKKAQQHGCSIIFTTKRIDICEALSARIGIIINQRLKYIGDLTTLQEHYAEYYVVELFLRQYRREWDDYLQYFVRIIVKKSNIKTIFERQFPNAELHDELTFYIKYCFQKTDFEFVDLYSFLEDMKRNELLSKYLIRKIDNEEIYSRIRSLSKTSRSETEDEFCKLKKLKQS